MDRTVPGEMRHLVRLSVLVIALIVVALAGCETIDTAAAGRAAANQAIRSEPPGITLSVVACSRSITRCGAGSANRASRGAQPGSS